MVVPAQVEEIKFGAKSKAKYANKHADLRNNGVYDIFDIPMKDHEKLLVQEGKFRKGIYKQRHRRKNLRQTFYRKKIKPRA